MKHKIVVLGGGGWGTALANLLSANHSVVLWAMEQSVVDEINSNHQNSEFLPDVLLNESLVASNDIYTAENADIIVNTIPTQHIRSVLLDRKPKINDKIIVNGSKGIETNTLITISKVFEQVLDLPTDNYVVISGPSHAEEVARKMPTAVVAASTDATAAKLVQELFTCPEFRVYTSDDVIGTEIGGSLKNVIAIAAGIIDGLGMGDNTKAALITRGLAELVRLGVACGARPWSFSGLSGLGDLFVTCNSRHSRNRKVGELIGSGKTLSDITSNMKMIAEGVSTTDSALNLGKNYKVEMPITEQVYEVLFQEKEPLLAIKDLMSRKSKNEWNW